MEMNFLPQTADEKIFEGDEGSYYAWSDSKCPWLSEAKLGAGRLALNPRVLALPHYADSSKIGFVLQGNCTIGMIFPETSEEKVMIAKEGDSFPVPMGSVSWWFNGGDSEVVIVFLGETSKAYVPGEFTYFFLAGTISVLGGFSPELISRTYNMNKDESNKLIKSQTGSLLVKVGREITFPQGNNEELLVHLETALPDIEVKNGGSIISLTAENFPLLGKLGFSARLVKLEPNVVFGPMYEGNSADQLIYVIRGSGSIQINGLNGKNVLDAEVKVGHLFTVQRFFTAAIIAGEEGLELFSFFNSSQPVFGKLAGNSSLWKALSPPVLQAALNVTPQFVENFKTKTENSTIIISPKTSMN